MSGNLFQQLKRRNVFRMAGLYLVGAWLLVQVASTLFPAFGVPGWALRGLVIVLALGFVPALMFATFRSVVEPIVMPNGAVAVRLEALFTVVLIDEEFAVSVTGPVVVIDPPEMNDPVSATVPAPAASVPGCTPDPAVIVTLPPLVVTPLEVLIDPDVAASDTAPPLVVMAPFALMEPPALPVNVLPVTEARLIEPVVAVVVTAPAPALSETLDTLS